MTQVHKSFNFPAQPMAEEVFSAFNGNMFTAFFGIFNMYSPL